MIVPLCNQRFTLAVLFIVSTMSSTVASQGTPEHWVQSFPLSSLQNSTADDLPERPDLSRALSYRETGASAEQIDPLNKTATIRFADEVTTVGDAARRILDPVGYELLATGPNVSTLLEELLDSPLPVNQREFKHLRVSEMLRALAGIGHVVVFDHVHRKTTFDPVPRYHRIGQPTQPDVVAGWVGRGPEQQLQNNLIVTPLDEAPLQKQGGVRPDTTFDTWQEVTGTGAVNDSGKTLFNRVEQMVIVNASSGPFISDTPIPLIKEYVVRADGEVTRLTAATELTLRRIASQFMSDQHTVVISDCTGDESVRAQALHDSMIRAALVRLGVDKRHHQTLACPENHSSKTPDGSITHVVALSLIPG